MPITPSGHEDAHEFIHELPTTATLRERLEALCAHLRRLTSAPPHPTEGARELSQVFTFIASGLDLFLEDDPDQAWATFARIRLWCVGHGQEASDPMAQPDLEDLHDAMATPELSLAGWADEQWRAGRIQEAAHLAAWWTAASLVEELPLMEAGEVEEVLDATLLAFCEPVEQPVSSLN